nr:FH1/FH2 domain-containing protein 1 [Pogona vitticeps]
MWEKQLRARSGLGAREEQRTSPAFKAEDFQKANGTLQKHLSREGGEGEEKEPSCPRPQKKRPSLVWLAGSPWGPLETEGPQQGSRSLAPTSCFWSHVLLHGGAFLTSTGPRRARGRREAGLVPGQDGPGGHSDRSSDSQPDTPPSGLLEDCAVQVLPSGHYLDLELSLLEQKEDLEGFYEDIAKGRRPILLLRTQLSVRVQAIIEKLYRSKGPELRRSLFSLKQLFQEDKDLVPEFVNSEGLTCLITVGAEADQNYQNYILRALSQIMLFVDGMMGVINHNETVQWLYTLCGSLYRLVVKTALKLLLVFVEYTESNALLLIQAILTVEQARGGFPWSPLVALLEQTSGADTELQVFAMTLINKTLAALPDQDAFYDVTDCLEQQGMERIIQQHVAGKGTDPDLHQQLTLYENTLKYEDGVEEPPLGTRSKERRKGEEGRRGGQRRSLGYLLAQEESRGSGVPVEEEGLQAPRVPTQIPTPVLDAERNKEDLPSPQSVCSSSVSCGPLSAPTVPVEGEQPGSLGERSIFKARFLENLAASQKEKMVAISRGRAEMLAEATPGAETAVPGWWGEGANGGGGGPEGKAPWPAPPPEPSVGGAAAADLPGLGAPHSLASAPSLASPPGSNQVLPGGCSIHHNKDGAQGVVPTKTRGLEKLFGSTWSPTGESWAGALDPRGPGEESGPGAGPEAREGPEPTRARTLRSQFSLEAEAGLQTLEQALVTPFRKGSEVAGGGPPVKPTPVPLKIRDLDFSDLGEEEDGDCLEGEGVESGLTSGQKKKKKTVKLFWRELKSLEGGPSQGGPFGPATLWASLEKVEVDTAKLEHLFESRAKEMPSAKVGSRFLVVLDPKRSNAINIGLTSLPPVHIIKMAILNFDEFAINKEGIEKLLMMVPTEEEKQKIQEAQLANPGVPLGSAEQFLLALSSVTELSARLQLWAFKLDYEAMEQEIAEPLFDLKVGMEQLAKSRTFKSILAALLAMGNFLNGSQSQGFELSYLAKVSEVKDTVHRQTLLHHLCHTVVEKFPETTDLYSEIAAIARSAKVDFDELAEGLVQLERRCKASWESLKAIAKHDTKPALKSKLVDFLQASTQKIVILKVVHRRVMNRFRSFLLYLGYDSRSAQEVKAIGFCRMLREFALEYRTCWERVLQQRKKRAACRERNKTRGRMITEMEKFARLPKPEEGPAPAMLTTSPDQKEEGSHESMTSVLISPAEPSGRRSRASRGVVKQSPPSTPASPPDDASGSSEDASEEIMDRLVKSVTQSTPLRPGALRERKRSRLNRKSLRRTLKNGLSDELVQALGLAQAAGMAV